MSKPFELLGNSKLLPILLIILLAGNILYNFLKKDDSERAIKLIKEVRNELMTEVKRIEEAQAKVDTVLFSLDETKAELLGLKQNVDDLNANYRSSIARSEALLRAWNKKLQEERADLTKMKEEILKFE